MPFEKQEKREKNRKGSISVPLCSDLKTMTVEDHGTETMALPKRFENNGLILEYLLLEELPNMARESLLPRSFDFGVTFS